MKSTLIVKVAKAALPLYLALHAAAQAQTNALDMLRTTYHQEVGRIDAGTQKKLADFMVALANKPDLEGFKVVEKASERFRSEKMLETDIPLAAAPKPLYVYQGLVALGIETRRQEVDLMSRYIAKLKELLTAAMLQKNQAERDHIAEELNAHEAMLGNLQLQQLNDEHELAQSRQASETAREAKTPAVEDKAAGAERKADKPAAKKTCPTCQGAGYVKNERGRMPSELICKTCKGKRVVE